MAVSREFVINAYQTHLARRPESEEVIAKYMDFTNESQVISVITASKEYFRKKFNNLKFEANSNHKFLVIGNCQATVLSKLIEAMNSHCSVIAVGLEGTNYEAVKSKKIDLTQQISDCDYIIIHNLHESFISKLISDYPDFREKMITIPAISYTAFHPDMGYIIRPDGSHVSGPTGDYHSLLAFWAWQNGLTADEAFGLYNHETYEFLGYFAHKDSSEKFLVNLAKSIGFPIKPMLSRWLSKGCFMHSINHPKLYVLADIARHILSSLNINYAPRVENYLNDDLAAHPCWDVFPEIARNMCVDGSYTFKRSKSRGSETRPVTTLTLKEFVDESFALYEKNKHLDFKPLTSNVAFSKLSSFIEDKKKETNLSNSVLGGRAINPYAKLKKHQLWRRSIEATPAQKVDPVVSSTLNITCHSKVATAGSCFAQHISRTLSNNGFTYYVPEDGSDTGLEQNELETLNYGVFSARYGNIYTSRQLVQLFDRAYGKFEPIDRAWMRKDGRYVDPFRPMVYPSGYNTVAEVEQARTTHLRHVREMFENLDIFVFTLGLTESWRRREDGALFPLAPGVAAGSMVSGLYEFVNFETHDVIADLESFLAKLAQVNPNAKVILTVSPVPLVATYEDRHVLTSTTYSKSALRSAADYIVRRYSQCEYFPSFEIITGNYIKSAYYEDDLRSVREEGVSHVMRLFMAHYSSGTTVEPDADLDDEIFVAAAKNNSVVCEEEALDPSTE